MILPPRLVLHCLSLWFVLSSLYRLLRYLRSSRKDPYPSNRISPISPNLLMVASVLLLSATLLLGAKLFLTDRLLTSAYWLAAALLFAGCTDAYIGFKRSRTTRPSPWLWFSSLTSFGVGIMTLGIVLYLGSSPGSEADGIILDYPVSGEWIVATGGRSWITNYHHGRPDSQNLAIDIVRADGNSDGAPIYGPAKGIVIKAIGDRGMGDPEPEGNLIILEATGGIQIWMAHLQNGSLLVGEGSSVKPGQPIARCGATGSADVAHLHIHAQHNGVAFPMYFGKEKRFLVRNDRVNVNE